ncbi:MAG: ComEC/Rec2 family competence protein [Acidobacteriaceae bacterium]|nr:ComEC/Rec2 family competence protein [Acidobacteriaceae bacterium]
MPALLTAIPIGLAFATTKGLRKGLPAVCAALVLAGIATQVAHRPTRTPKLNADDGETVLLSGCITNPPVFSPNREQFTLNLIPRAAARLSVALKPNEALSLRYGQQVEVSAKIRLPRNYQNPDAFDYAGYLAQQHIYWIGSVAGPQAIRVIAGECGSRPQAWIYSFRAWALERLANLYPNDPQTTGLLQATLIGDSTNVDRRWTNDFRLTGTYHALVISGLHISAVALTLLALFRLFRMKRVPALCLAALACWLYASISGFNAPAVRAAAGFSLFLVASCFFRKARTLNLLAAFGFIYLAFEPDQLFDPGFQLSFLSVAVIALFALPLMERLVEPLRSSVKRFDQKSYDPQLDSRAAQWRVELRLLAETIRAWTGVPERLTNLIVPPGVRAIAFAEDAVLISACVQFGVALPMACYFHRLSISGLSANVVVIPLLCLVVPFGFASIFTGWHFLAVFTKALLYCAELAAGWHVRFEPAWRIAAVPFWIALAFAASLVLLAISIRLKSRWMPPALVCSLGLFGVLFWQPWKPKIQPGFLELTAIDVNQGDSLFLAFPDGETMLVDAGGFPGMERMVRKPQMDVGEDVVSPYLWSRRIRRLDYAVLTHGHSDHMGGLPAILDNFRPRALWIGAEPETREWKNVEQHAAIDHVQVCRLNRNSAPFTIGGARVRVLAPSPDYLAGDIPQNNDSLVLEVTYGRRSILLTGDAERPIEDDLVNNAQLHPVTLLKVGHHGSRTSSSQEFLDQVTPQFALISDGYKNQFHHPHPEVLARLAEHHTATFRTDLRGLITFRTDGNQVDIETFR